MDLDYRIVLQIILVDINFIPDVTVSRGVEARRYFS